MNKGQLFIISSPSGGGKSTLIKALLEKMPELVYSISATTRLPRNGEKNGVDYFFMNEADFLIQEKNGAFLESAQVFDYHYGTPKAFIEQMNQEHRDVILDIDVQGALQIKKKYPATFIFLMPPSLEELKKRLMNRGTDSDEVIARRLKEAKNEIDFVHEYDYVIPSLTVEKSFQQASSIILAQRIVYQNQIEYCQNIMKEFHSLDT